MKDHERINKLLPGFALGELSEEDRSAVKGHLGKCGHCRIELQRLEALVECTDRMSELSADEQMCESAKEAFFAFVVNERRATQNANVGLRALLRAFTASKTGRLAAAAVVGIVVLSGLSFWPKGGSDNGQWWLEPSSAWGQEIIAKLEKVQALVFRGQSVFVGRYGSTHVSGTWSRSYEAEDRSRKDRYYEPTDEDTFGDSSEDSVLQHTTWEVSDGEDLIMYTVSLEFECYTTRTVEGGAFQRDPVENLRFYVNLLDKADRLLGTEMFDEHECIGFDIEARKYGDNPKEWIDRIWLDVETKLPVRIEQHGRGITSRPGETFTFIQDQFEYYAEIPAAMFEPEIPEGFIYAEPSEIQAAREREEKGEMVFADVPTELRDEIVAALKNVETASYRERVGHVKDGSWVLTDGDMLYLSRYNWRKDSYQAEELRRRQWFVIDKDDWGETSFDFNDKNFRMTETIVDFRERSYQTIAHDSRKHPENPMDGIIFLASLVNKSDRFTEDEEIEGAECYCFELSAKKYGTNPETSKHRLWFDKDTKLPVRMEFEWLQDDGPRRMIREQFEWDPELPGNIFSPPEIPAGFEELVDE